MTNQLELDKIKNLMVDVYSRYRRKAITREEARCEVELLRGIVDTVELVRIKEQIKEVKSLLTNNKGKKA